MMPRDWSVLFASTIRYSNISFTCENMPRTVSFRSLKLPVAPAFFSKRSRSVTAKHELVEAASSAAAVDER